MRRPEVIDAEFEVIEPGSSYETSRQDLTRAVSLAIAKFIVGLLLSAVCLIAFKPLQHFLQQLLF